MSASCRQFVETPFQCTFLVTHYFSLFFSISYYCIFVFPRLTNSALVVAAPPCSLYGPACASVHRRSASNPMGDLKVFKVRLARRIWLNFVARTKKEVQLYIYTYYLFSYVLLYIYSIGCSMIIHYIMHHIVQGRQLL